MLCKACLWVGSIFGWGLALIDLIFMPWPHDRATLVCMVALSLGIVCTASQVVRAHQRPIDEAFEFGFGKGYFMARQDVIREGSGRGAKVTPIRRVPDGLGAFNRTYAGS